MGEEQSCPPPPPVIKCHGIVWWECAHAATATLIKSNQNLSWFNMPDDVLAEPGDSSPVVVAPEIPTHHYHDL